MRHSVDCGESLQTLRAVTLERPQWALLCPLAASVLGGACRHIAAAHLWPERAAGGTSEFRIADTPRSGRSRQEDLQRRHAGISESW